MVEATLTLLALIVLIVYLSYSYLFYRLPEPERRWCCSYCRKEAIGMKREMEHKGWDLEEPYPYLCPDCRWLDKKSSWLI